MFLKNMFNIDTAEKTWKNGKGEWNKTVFNASVSTLRPQRLKNGNVICWLKNNTKRKKSAKLL